jgi:hypothetical protein
MLSDDFIKQQNVMAQKIDADGKMIDSALEIIKKFIIERNLIIFGGLAIDYALRLKGDKIYPDDQRPDFDFLSPKSVDDAYDLAEILFRAGYKDVGVIRGLHVQTMRVRIDFIYIADIGYVPPEVYKNIPTLSYANLRFVHPNYQRMDSHLSFSYPFQGPPREVIFQRWDKDLKRFNLLNKYYGIEAAAVASTTAAGTTPTVKLNTVINTDVALNGFAAYAALSQLITDANDFPKLNYTATSTASSAAITVTFDSPAFEKDVYLVTPNDISEYSFGGAAGSKKTCYMPYLDLFPETCKCGNTVIMSIKNRLLSCSILENNVKVVSTHYLLLWFLYKNHITGDQNYLNYYAYTMNMIKAAEIQYGAEFINSPFAPSLETIGKINHDPSYAIRMANSVLQTGKAAPPKIFEVEPDVANGSILQGLPLNYYPAPGKTRPTFDYNANKLFLRAGQEMS